MKTKTGETIDEEYALVLQCKARRDATAKKVRDLRLEYVQTESGKWLKKLQARAEALEVHHRADRLRLIQVMNFDKSFSLHSTKTQQNDATIQTTKYNNQRSESVVHLPANYGYGTSLASV